MRKWTYLVAALLLTGTTATFTGCIDTDEPAGITDLRGAKAELIKAQAAVKLVEVDMQKALVAQQLVLTEGLKLANEGTKIQNDLKALEIEKENLKIELQKATNEAEKAEIAVRIAAADKKKADIENGKAIAAEKFKEAILVAQKATALAQESYDNAIKAIEAAKLLMTTEEANVLKAAQNALNTANTDLGNAIGAVTSAANELNKILADKEVVSGKDDLEYEIEKAMNELTKANLTVAILQEKINKDYATTDWEKEVDALKKDIETYTRTIAQAEIDRKKVEVSPEATKAKDAKDAALAAETTAKNKYDAAYVAQDLKIKPFELSVAKNAAVTDALTAANTGTVFTNAYVAGVFSYAKGNYSQEDYIGNVPTATPVKSAVALEEMQNLVKAALGGIKPEDIAWSTYMIDSKKKDQTNATNAYTTSFKKWEKAVADFKAGTTSAYDLTQFKLDKDAALGVLIAIKGGTTYKTDNEKNGAYNTYIQFRKNMEANGQINRPTTFSAKKYDELSTLLASGSAEDYVPATFTAVPTPLQLLTAASKDAFGIKLYLFNGQPRLTAPTASELAAAMKDIKANFDVSSLTSSVTASYAKLGAKLESEHVVTYLQNILEQADTFKELQADLTAQQAALTAEIAANTATMDVIKKAWTDAKAATKVAQAAYNKLFAAIDDIIDAALIKQSATQQVMTILEVKLGEVLNGKLSVAEFKQGLTDDLITEKANVINRTNELEVAKKNLALYEAGEYTKAYEIKKAEGTLARAKADMALCQSVYDKAVASLKLVIETLVK